MTEESSPRRPRRTARRAATALALAGVAALALGACRVQPGAAAFVGNDRIPRTQVDQAVDTFSGKSVGKSVSSFDFGGARQSAVANMVVANLARRVAQAQGVTLKQPDYAGYAEAFKSSASDPFVRSYAEAQSYVTSLADQAEPVSPTDADLQYMEAFLEQNENVSAGQSPAELRQILDTPDTERFVGAQRELQAAAKTYHVSISPVYGTVIYAVHVPLQGGRYVGGWPVTLSKASNDLVATPSATPSD